MIDYKLISWFISFHAIMESIVKGARGINKATNQI